MIMAYQKAMQLRKISWPEKITLIALRLTTDAILVQMPLRFVKTPKLG